MVDKKDKKILLTGGGTGGSVTPLLAVADELGWEKFEYLWLGTRRGPERQMVEREKIKFIPIVSGKLRRYFSLATFFVPLFVLIGFIQSFFIILKLKPRVIISAGSFVSVPVVWAGWILRKKIIVHQQDVKAGLANRLMSLFAHVITVTFKQSLNDYGRKARWIGNPTRMQNAERGMQSDNKFFNLKSSLPVLLVLGGGTGAVFINNLVAESLPQLTKICQIIHVTGKGKQITLTKNYPYYYPYEFLNTGQMAEAYQAATVVVSRCGMATLSELSYFGKPAILIYLPGHQEYNARVFEEESAAIVLDQPVLDKSFFVKNVKNLLSDTNRQTQLSANIKKVIKKGAAAELAKIIKNC